MIHNMQRTESTLKKKLNQICYHFVQESVAMGESRTMHVKTLENMADLATKVITTAPKREHLVSELMYDIYDDH